MKPTPPQLDRTAATPIAEQLAAHYRDAILAGRLRAGDRLPPIREVAEMAGVTKTTVQEAYRRLGERGLVEGTVGRGTTVLRLPADTPGGDAGSPLSSFASAALRQSTGMPGAPPLPAGQPLVANFAELSPSAERFPVADLRAAMDHVLCHRGGELLGYAGAVTGLPELRSLLARRSEPAASITSADDILITSGGQQALDLVLRTFCTPGDAVVVTAPSYHQMYGLLTAHGLRIAPVPYTATGIDVRALADTLKSPDIRLVYLMPSFHNPTGRTLDLATRRAVVEVIARTGVPILEDEYQHALRFRGEPLPSLRTLDPRGLTVTAMTFSKGLFPGLRTGWVQAGPALLRPMAAVKRFMDLETSALLQAALVEFVNRGAMDRYLEALRGELLIRHTALQRALADELPSGCSLSDPDGGFVAWLELPEPGQGDRLAELAAARGVRVVPGRVFDPQGKPSRGVRLSLTRADAPQIRAGAAVLLECIRDLVLGTSAATNRSFL
ncbi:MAG: PLP-dependent aminotransferase family protein [Planctomycetes bacterium]|nr:PLP-dependent aminotransferase family protein [Planctomycetota bacterium]